MASTITWEIPDSLYQELVEVQHEMDFPRLEDVVAQAVKRYVGEVRHQTWVGQFRDFQKQVRKEGGFSHLGSTKDEIIESLREQRREIFEKEYADYYR